MKRLCVILLLAILLTGCSNVQESEGSAAITEREWTPIYNSHVCGLQVSWIDTKCAYSEELTAEQIALLLPEKELKNTDISAIADFKEDDTVVRVILHLKRADTEISIVMGEDAERYACCWSLEEDAKPSACGDVSYVIYESRLNLLARTTINDLPVYIRLYSENAQQNKAFFEEILECFSWYPKGEPVLAFKN